MLNLLPCSKQIIVFALLIITSFFVVAQAYAVSDPFPKTELLPIVSEFLPSPNNIYYCSPTGSNTTGNGSISNPWVDFIGATSGGAGAPIAAGDLLYLRGGTYPVYPYVNFSRSLNMLSRDGTAANPIVVTNYPGEIAQWNYHTTWSVTIGGDYIKFIGTKVGNEYGIRINGGMTFWEGDYAQVSGVDFIGGADSGDLNPAMLADMLNGTSQRGLVVSHNRFRDSVWQISEHRMKCLNFFATTDVIVEYNIFQNNLELRVDAGSILFKDTTNNATVRHNKFINSVSGLSFQSQGGALNGLVVYGNLFYNIDSCFVITNRLGNSGAISIYNNVVLASASFYTYFNYDNRDWTVHGDYYDNIIDGIAFTRGWPPTSVDDKNIPDFFDYNLWYSSSDRNTPSGWVLPSGYFNHAVDAPQVVTYNATSFTVIVADDYSGRNAGRFGGNIGGFSFGGSSGLTFVASPQNFRLQSVSVN